MATTVAVLEAALHADTKAFDRAMGKSESKMQKLGKVAGIAGLAIAGGLAVAFKVGFDEMIASQKVMAQTEAVIESTGAAANVTAEHVDDYAQELLQLSGVDDEVIASGENLLLTFRNIHNEMGAGNDIFDQATLAALDLSVAMGKDLQSSVLLVGKALNDPIKGMGALRRVGVTLSKSQENLVKKLVAAGDVMGAQKIILAELTAEFGGSAEAAGETLPAQLNKAREAFADITAGLVVQLLPALTAVLSKVSEWLEVLKEHPKWAKAMVIGLAALSAALLTASVAQIALNVAVLANPYVLIAVSVLAYAAAVVYLANRFDFARKHWQLFLIVLGAGPVIIATIVKAIIRHWDTIKGALNTLREVAVRVWNAIGTAIRNQIQPIITFIGWVRSAIDVLEDLADKIRNLPTPRDIVGGVLDRIPGLAAGGIVTRPTLAVVGEAGPEAVIPLSQMSSSTRAATGVGGGDIHIYANVIGSEREVLQWLERARKRQQRQGG